MQPANLIPTDEFCSRQRVELSFIQRLEDYGLVETTTVEEVCYLPEEQLVEVEKLARLHYHLHINFEGLQAVNHLLSQAEKLRAEVNRLRNRLRLYEAG